MNRKILRLALPAVASNIMIPLLGLCDTAISGHLGSASYIGAVAVGSMMLNVIYWLFGFLRMGTTGLTANAFGAGDVQKGEDVLRKSLSVAATVGLGAILLQRPLLNLLSLTVSGEPEVMDAASRYFRICVCGVPAQLAVMSVTGWFIGMQNTVVPMSVAIGMNAANMVLSLILAVALGYGFDGIAYGTLAASWAGAAAALWMVRVKLRSGTSREQGKGREIREIKEGRDNAGGKAGWGDMFRVNGALFVRSACIMGVTLAVTSVGARLGAVTLAANAVIMQFFIFFSYFMDGFAFSGEALTGSSLGAGDTAGLLRTVRYLSYWGVSMALAFFAVYLGFSDNIAALLTDDREVLEGVTRLRLFIILLPPVTVAAFICDGIFIGLTRTTDMMKATVAGTVIFFAALAQTLVPLTDILLWTAFESYLLVRGCLLTLRLRALAKNWRASKSIS